MPHLFTQWADEEAEKGNAEFSDYLRRIVQIIEHPNKPLVWAFDQSPMEAHPEVREMLRLLSDEKWSPRSTGADVFVLWSSGYGWYRLFQAVPDWFDHEIRAAITSLSLPNECRPECVANPRPPCFQDFIDCNHQSFNMTIDEEMAADEKREEAEAKATEAEVTEHRDARNENLWRAQTSHFSGEPSVTIPVSGTRDDKPEAPAPKAKRKASKPKGGAK